MTFHEGQFDGIPPVFVFFVHVDVRQRHIIGQNFVPIYRPHNAVQIFSRITNGIHAPDDAAHARPRDEIHLDSERINGFQKGNVSDAFCRPTA